MYCVVAKEEFVKKKKRKRDNYSRMLCIFSSFACQHRLVQTIMGLQMIHAQIIVGLGHKSGGQQFYILYIDLHV